jgi:hypothetical protein
MPTRVIVGGPRYLLARDPRSVTGGNRYSEDLLTYVM